MQTRGGGRLQGNQNAEQLNVMCLSKYSDALIHSKKTTFTRAQNMCKSHSCCIKTCAHTHLQPVDGATCPRRAGGGSGGEGLRWWRWGASLCVVVLVLLVVVVQEGIENERPRVGTAMVMIRRSGLHRKSHLIALQTHSSKHK